MPSERSNTIYTLFLLALLSTVLKLSCPLYLCRLKKVM